MSEKNFRTATVIVKDKTVETLNRISGETFKEFVKRAETAARHNKGRISENYRGKPGEESPPKS